MSNPTAEQRDPWGPWDEVETAIQEIEWFVTRKKNLAELVDPNKDAEIWADILQRDVDDLRRCILEARGS